MIVVVVLMLVFFLLGLTVMTAATTATAGVNARIQYRQAYYIARSTIDVLDESLQYGELGESLRDAELERLLTAVTAGETGYSEENVQLELPLSFGANGPENVNFVDGKADVRYDVVSYIVPSTNNTQAYVSLLNTALSFRTDCGGKTYGVRVTYQFTGWAQLTNGEWVWRGGWRLRSIA